MARGDALRDPETLVKAGVVLFAAVLLGGIAVLFFGQAAGGTARGRRHAEAPPAPGQVPPERHQHVQTSSAR
jgi:hypothetical protein